MQETLRGIGNALNIDTEDGLGETAVERIIEKVHYILMTFIIVETLIFSFYFIFIKYHLCYL